MRTMIKGYSFQLVGVSPLKALEKGPGKQREKRNLRREKQVGVQHTPRKGVKGRPQHVARGKLHKHKRVNRQPLRTQKRDYLEGIDREGGTG